MMSVLEFAKEYNVTTFQVLKICKRLNINVTSENDMLSEKDVANIKDKVNYYEENLRYHKMMYNLEFLKSLGFNALPDNNSLYYDIKVDMNQDSIGEVLPDAYGNYMVKYNNGLQVKCNYDNSKDLVYELSDNKDASKEQKVVFTFSKTEGWSTLRNVTDNIYVSVKENDKKDNISIRTDALKTHLNSFTNYDDEENYKDIENEELNEETYVNMIIESLNKDPIMTGNPKLKEGVKLLLPVLRKNSERVFEKYINKTDAIIEKYEMEKQAEIARLDENISRIRNIASNRQGVRQ